MRKLSFKHFPVIFHFIYNLNAFHFQLSILENFDENLIRTGNMMSERRILWILDLLYTQKQEFVYLALRLRIYFFDSILISCMNYTSENIE